MKLINTEGRVALDRCSCAADQTSSPCEGLISWTRFWLFALGMMREDYICPVQLRYLIESDIVHLLCRHTQAQQHAVLLILEPFGLEPCPSPESVE